MTSDRSEAGDTAAASPGRRTFLAAAGGGAGLLALAACGGGSSGAAQTPAADSSGASGSSGGAALGKVSDIPVGGAVSAKDANGKPIILSQPSAGTVVAFSAICTHMGCTVAPGGKTLNCPCHGSVYDSATGKNIGGPAPRPLAKVTVHVADGEVLAG